ncbi:hypothetical protein [Butyrivibrio sp. FC2001]|uniref:hypothetical protein n=1 Tax=Butyrivibrio sp. FC2001 TaxID=1280671 RepID=UPI000479660E|nr:hypothetical protein [Butyrivibrio sp. FC2001]
MGKRISLDKKEKTILAVAFVIHTMLLFLLSNYSKAMETYADELVYYDLAKSMFEGTELQMHGVSLQFSKLAYSFVLLPTFLIGDITARVHVIMLINSLLMSTPIILSYLLCKELNVSRTYSIMAAVLSAFWPDIVISGTFMSENLFFPLSCLCFYFILLDYKYKKTGYKLIVLALLILAYFTKEVGICLALSYVATEILSGIGKKGSRQNLKKPVAIIAFIIAALLCYITVRYLFFGGFTNTYIIGGALNFSYYADCHKLLYLLYTIIYYLAAFTLAFYVLPVLMPLINNKKYNPEVRKFLLYTFLLFIGSILVITVTVTAREDFGKTVPAVHLRYVSQLVVPFSCIFFAGLSNDDKIEGRDLKLLMPFMIATGLVYKGVYNTCTTGNIALLYCYPVRKLIPNIKPFYPVGVTTALIFAVGIILFYLVGKSDKKKAAGIFFAGTLVLSAINIVFGLKNVYDTYHVDQELIDEMVLIDDYFKEYRLETTNVAFVDDSQFSKEAKVYDLYFRSADREYMILSEEVSEGILTEPIWRTIYTPQQIDFYIVNKNSSNPLSETGLDTIPELSGSSYIVYKNN